MSAALAIFVKTPGLSPVKTRLAKIIGSSHAGDFHNQAAHCVQQSAALALAGVSGSGYFAVAEKKALDHSQWQSWPVLWQGEGGLGDKMFTVYQTLRRRHGAAVLIGADIPQVRPAMLLNALAALATDSPTWVYGPSADGGFWLIGGNCPIPEAVWTSVRYSQADTGEQFLAGLAKVGAGLTLPVLNDIDEFEDLVLLHQTFTQETQWLCEQVRLGRWLTPLVEKHYA